MTTDNPSDKGIFDEEGSKTFFNHLLQIWVLPEIERRLQLGSISPGYEVTKAQIVLDPQQRSPQVRLNDEVRAIAKAKFKSGISKGLNETIFEHELEYIQELNLTDHDDPDAGHVTLLLFKGQWIIHFDFRQNKGKAKLQFDAAIEFFEAAKQNYEKNLKRPFVDNLFSAVELLATAQLFTMSEQDYVRKPRHDSTQLKYNSFIKIGNAKPDYADALNKLRGMTDAARYLKRAFNIEEDVAKKYLVTVEDMITYTRQFIS